MNLPLTPLRFLIRAEQQFGPKVGVIDGDRSWTYSEFASRCRRLAAVLTNLGLRPGGRVAFLGCNSHHLLESYYAVPLAGGVLLPLNVRLRSEDFAYILADSGAQILLVAREFVDQVSGLPASLPGLSCWLQLEGSPDRDWLHPESYEALLHEGAEELQADTSSVDEYSPAEIFYTSGTTGRPKGVALSHRNLFLHALGNICSMRPRDSDVHLHTIGLFHANGWGAPQSMTAVGATHVLLPGFRPDHVLDAIARHRITTLYLVPTMATTLLQSPEIVSTDLGSVREITLGGSAANPDLVGRIEQAFECVCIGGYGLTEAGPVVSHAVPKDHLNIDDDRRYSLQATAGFPTLDAEVQLRSPSGEVLAWDGRQVGELFVRGDGVSSDSVGAEGWLPTGDLASICADGYITIVDRRKDIIVSGGENISSLEVERVLSSHPDVLESAVVAVEDPKWGETPLACVVLREGSSADWQQLLAHCRLRLAHFKCPRRFEFLEELPRGQTGKILKRVLRDRYRP